MPIGKVDVDDHHIVSPDQLIHASATLEKELDLISDITILMMVQRVTVLVAIQDNKLTYACELSCDATKEKGNYRFKFTEMLRVH